MKKPDKRIGSDNYRDYVIKDGKFIGAFEEMYQNIEDPWNHGSATAIQYDIILLLLRRYNIGKDREKILDLGCGKGAFTARMKKQFPVCSIMGVDISPTAIKYAKKTYGHLGIKFAPLDIQVQYLTINTRYDLVIMSQLIWYILPEIRGIMNHIIEDVLEDGGYLLISQAFYKPEEQTYGREIISTVEDLLGFIRLPVTELVESNRLTNHDAILLFRK